MVVHCPARHSGSSLATPTLTLIASDYASSSCLEFAREVEGLSKRSSPEPCSPGARVAFGPRPSWRKDYVSGIESATPYFRRVPYLDAPQGRRSQGHMGVEPPPASRAACHGSPADRPRRVATECARQSNPGSMTTLFCAAFIGQAPLKSLSALCPGYGFSLGLAIDSPQLSGIGS